MNTFTYKKDTLDWLSGKYQTYKFDDEVWFDAFQTKNNRLQHLMDGLYFPFGYHIEGVIQGKTNDNEGTEYSVLYGNYENKQQTTNLGFIMILDNEYNPVQIFKKYSNDEWLGNILSLNVGDDGRFYLVEIDNNNYMRLVLLNNILAKSPTQEDYQLVQRQTYRFENQSYFQPQNLMITKHPQNAKYLIVQVQSSGLNIITKAIEFTINVGATNEWNYYSQTKSVSGTTYWLEQNDLIASWNDSNQLAFKVIYTHSIGEHVYYEAISKVYDSDTLSDQSFDLGDILYSYDKLYYTQGIIKNFDIGYMTIYYDDNSAYTSADIYKIDFTNNTKTRIFSDVINTVDNCGIRLTRHNDDIFFYYSNYFKDPDQYQSYVGLIVNDTIYKTLMEENIDFDYSNLYLISAQKQFNLYTMYVQIGNNVYIGKLLYIDKNNNRLYADYTSLNPNFAVLYDSNDIKIFARTLYNKNINGATTTSIVQVPNQFLNDTTIAKENLGGKTYLIITTNEEEYTKNQYEEVYINFANTWHIINQNDTENPIINIAGASRLNQSISGTNDYSDCKAIKYRINYQDETSSIYSFTSDQIARISISQLDRYRYTWKIYNPRANSILSIDIISNDEETVFQSIDMTEIPTGKFYTLTQDVRVV